jgi:hypothetical protein
MGSEEKGRLLTFVDQIRECLGSKYVSDETRVKVESWLEKKPEYDEFADYLKKLKGMINEGQKTEEKERYLKKEDVAKDEDLFI